MVQSRQSALITISMPLTHASTGENIQRGPSACKQLATKDILLLCRLHSFQDLIRRTAREASRGTATCKESDEVDAANGILALQTVVGCAVRDV